MPRDPQFQTGPLRKAPRRPATDDAMRAAGFEVTGPLDARKTGRGAHDLIGQLAAAGDLRPDVLTLMQAVGRHALVAQQKQAGKTPYVLAARQRLLLATAAYFHTCAPLSDWELVGREVTVGDVRFDLVWQERSSGRLWVEEVKTHRVPLRERVALEAQVPRYLAAARAKWQDAFAGLRVCLVLAARKSYSVTADGERTELVR
jgi:hypothetical protein